MRRIIFLNRFFFPDHSATGQLLSDLAFHLKACGHDVSVIAARQRYDAAAAALPRAETVAGVHVRRVSTSRFGRSVLFGRALDDVSLYATMWTAVLSQAQRGDILVAKTDPPLLSLLARQAARRRGLQVVNWLQDLYPEVAMRLGVPLIGGPVGEGLARMRDAALRAARANVVVGQGMADTVLARGIPADRVHVVPNWCDDEEICALPAVDNPLRREWGLERRFVVGYSGNLGRAHEFDTILGAAERLRHEPRIAFLCVGGGHRFDTLVRAVGERGLEGSFRFAPYQERRALKFSLGLPDVHWISLRPQLEGLIFPSKLYGIAAAGRPVIAIVAPDGEVAGLVRDHACGMVVAPGDAEGLASALASLAADGERCAAMGARARAMLEAQFTRRQAFERWRRLLEAIG